MCSQNKASPGWQRRRIGADGQSTIEFALTMVLISGFMFLFFQLSMLMSFGSYVQYATFMAARAYLSAGMNPKDQEDRARTVIQQMLKASGNPGNDRWPTVAKGDGGTDGSTQGLSFDASQFSATDRNYSWLRGIRYSFKGRVFLMPIGKGAAAAKSAATPLSLISESFLGREMTYQDCDSAMKDLGMYDNGC